jgi:hypothetical protein
MNAILINNPRAQSWLLTATLLVPMALIATPTLAASAAVTTLLSDYQQQGAGSFSAPAGVALWNLTTEGRSCTDCHGNNPTAVGQHQKTLKPIEPLAPSRNAKRLTDVKTIQKWLLRNCKSTLERECTPQEKGDFLTWLSQQ